MPPRTSRRRRAQLGFALAGVGLLLGALWWSVQLAEPDPRGPRAAEPAGAPDGRDQDLARVGSPTDAEGRISLALGESPPESPSAGVPEESTLGGRIVLDGSPVSGGTVVVRAGGGWERATEVDSTGSFWIGTVPAAELELEFELPSPSPRRLLVARVPLTATAGQNEKRLFDWTSTEVNLRVLGSGGAGGGARADARATVQLEGTGLAASVETDEHGKASLSLVASGVLRLAAVRADGSQGEATLDLDAVDELESVVIRARAKPR